MKTLLKISLSLIISSTCLIGNGQNLVPNPSFEDTVQCPSSTGELFNSVNWNSPTSGSPDYFNSCHTLLNNASTPNNFFGNQNPYHGNSYAGFGAYQLPNVREYLQVQLDSILQSGVNYCVSYYVSLAEVSGYSIKQIGLYFSNTLINNPITTTLPFTPQIENNSFISDSTLWVKVTGMFTAVGGEEYLIIGNFNNDVSTDTLGVSNNSNASYYYIDSIEVKRCSPSSIDENHLNNIKISPNPANDYFNIDIGDNNNAPYSLKLYNAMGQELFSLINVKSKTTRIDISKYNTNLLFVKIESQNKSFTYKLLKP